MEYENAIKILTGKDNFYIDLGLERISKVLEELGNPQDCIKFIHVAGTNGKGSVCAMLASILQEAGYKTGLYTSPHIWEYTERIKINGIDISKKDFADYIEKISNIKIHLTEFEILTVLMFLYFKENNVDIAVLETGLGGRLDATNVIKKNICSVITRIDLDHTDRLGDTKEEIAYEKAGIIKPNCPVITAMDFESIKNKAKEMDSDVICPIEPIENKYIESLSLKGKQQEENLGLALTVINHFFKEIEEKTIINGLKNVKHPCRFEYIKEKNLIIDACHNPNGIQALRNNLDTYFPNQKRRFIFGCLKTKDAKTMMEILFREGDEVYLNGFDYPNAYTYKELQKICPVKANKYSPEVNLPPDKLNIICGSFYMISGLKMSF
jgi:dihydrofolate synthase/folylpolyglutamate synthase